jgi:hypothetical protein
LQTEFNSIFNQNDPSAPSPRDYLEKIIQIPFWVRSMHADGFARLVTALTGQQEAERHAPPEWESLGQDTNAAGDSARLSPPPQADVARSASDKSRDVVPSRRTDRDIELTPLTLVLTDQESAFIRRLSSLLRSPRATKRFINTYQLLRVNVRDVKSYLELSEYEPVLMLLAVMTGTLHLSDEKAQQLASLLTEQSLAELLSAAGNDWASVAYACRGLPIGRVTPAVAWYWLPQVARYSFYPTLL